MKLMKQVAIYEVDEVGYVKYVSCKLGKLMKQVM